MGMALNIQHFTWRIRTESPAAITFRETDVFHKVKANWKVTTPTFPFRS